MDDSQVNRPRRVARGAALLALLFAVACGWFQLVGDAPPASFEVDEAEWIAAGIHTWQLARTGQSADAGATEAELAAAAARPWRLGIQESTFGWMNPVLPKFAFGFAAQVAGMEHSNRRIYPRFHPQGIDRPKADANRARMRFLPALGASRLVTSIVAAGVAALAFAVARSVAGLGAGAAVYLLWLASPTAQHIAVYVRTGLFPLLFGLAALLVAMHRRRELVGAAGPLGLALWSAVLGLLCGLAVGSKLNGALVSFAVPLWLLAGWLTLPRDRRPSLVAPSVALAVTGAVCAAIFWATLPGLWGDPPVAAVGELLTAWDDFHRFMVRLGGDSVDVPPDVVGRLGLVAERVFFGNEPGFELTGWAIGAAGVPLGLLALAAAARRGSLPALQLAIYCVVVAAGTALWVPLDRPRFYEPFVLLTALVQAVLLGFAARAVAGRRGTVEQG